MKAEPISYRHLLIGLIAMLSIWARIDHRYHYRKLNPDSEIIMATAAHMEEGRGGVLDHWNAGDLANPIILPQRATMPGYTYLLLFCQHFSQDWLRASWWIEIGAILLLFGAVILWMRQLVGRLDSLELGLALLCLGFSPAPLHYLGATDMLSLTAFCWGSLGLFFMQKWLLGGGVLALLGLGLAAGFRHAYLPLMGLLPMMLLMLWWQVRRRNILLYCLVSGLLVSAVAGILIGWKGLDGSMIDAVETQWHLVHLRWVEPFMFKTFFYYGLPHELRLNEFWPMASLLLKVAAFGFSAWLLVRLIRFSDAYFNLLFILTSLGVVLLLSYFSIKVPAEEWNEIGFWTFLMETRYYAAPMILCFLASFAQMRKGWGKGWIQAFLIMALCAGGGVSLFQKYQIYVQGNYSGTFGQSCAVEINRFAKQDPSTLHTNLLYNQEDSRIGELYNMVSVPMGISLDSLQTLPRTQALSLLVLLREDRELTPSENAWIERSDTEKISENEIGSWWRQELYPNMD